MVKGLINYKSIDNWLKVSFRLDLYKERMLCENVIANDLYEIHSHQ